MENIGSVILGAVTTRLGSNYVYACTEAVEEVTVQKLPSKLNILIKLRLMKI